MFKKLRFRLTLLYTLTTGIILTLVVISISINSQLSTIRRIDETFQTQVMNITTKLQTDNSFNITWLAATEAENDLLIHIEENGTPLLFKGAWEPPSGREFLLEKAASKARELGTDISVQPVTTYSISPVFEITGNHRDRYQCIAMSYPSSRGYKSVLLLYYISPSLQTLNRQRLFFAGMDVLGIAALYLVARFFVKRSLRPIQQSKRRQQEFIAAASHELRSPLMVIQTSAQAIDADPERTALFTGNIRSECKRMARLISDMLTLACADNGNWSVRFSPLDPNTFLLDLYESYEPVCQEKKIPFRLDLSEDSLPMIQGDQERLTQLLGILIDNALAYCGNCKPLLLKASTAKNRLLIQVIDHGPGIPNDQKAQVFDRFYRSDKSRKDKQHFGLGLSIARELAVLHKGELTLRDTEGGGCTFVLSLPVLS